MNKEKQIREMVKVVRKLTFDLRTNMTSITRYVRHERAKSPTLTEGQFIDRHLEYRELANIAVDNILKCINDNEELRQIESMRFEEGCRKQSEGEWIYDEDCEGFVCSVCVNSALNNYRGLSVNSNFCPNCGAHMKGGKD